VQYLINRHVDKEDEVYVYDPATGDRRVRRVATPRQREEFGDSTIDYENLRCFTGDIIDMFKYRLEKEAIVEREPCYVILVTPASEKANSIYGFRRFYRAKRGVHFLLVEYYDTKGKLLKIQKNTAVFYKEGVWRPAMVEMRYATNDVTTLLVWVEGKRVFNPKLLSGIFTTSYLVRAGR